MGSPVPFVCEHESPDPASLGKRVDERTPLVRVLVEFGVRRLGQEGRSQRDFRIARAGF